VEDEELDALEELLKEERDKQDREKAETPKEKKPRDEQVGAGMEKFIEGTAFGVVLMVAVVALIHLGIL